MKRILAIGLSISVAIAFLSSCQKAPELTLSGPSTVGVSADGDNSSITFTTNRDWSASSSDSWIHVSPSSGSASDGTITVSVRCDANTTYDDRNGTVTIRAEELSQTVSVKQPANLGVILPKQLFDLQSGATTIEVEVQANVDYSVTPSVDWIRQTGTKGLTSKTLVFSIEENNTYDPREGSISIKPQVGIIPYSSVPEQVISVKQAQKDALIIERTSYDMPYGGGEIEIKVEANVAFDVTPSEDWLHYVSTKALSSSTVLIKVDENETYGTREGKVEIAQQNGSLKHTITVKQAGRIAVSSITLNKTSLTLTEGETEKLYATVNPYDATDKTVTWSSSNIEYASVNEEGLVNAIKEGSATITAEAGGKKASCFVTIQNIIPITAITLNSRVSLMVGESLTLVPSITPQNATETSFTWRSSDKQIVFVDEKGTLKALAEGTATITVTIGELSASCSVTVNTPTYVGRAVDLGIVITREDGTTYELYWADCNLGASNPEEYGEYYAWGETKTKYDYSWPTYKWAKGVNDQLIKYCPKEKTDYWKGSGKPDGKIFLDSEDDVAHVKLGSNWRIPTSEEILALTSQCDWSKTIRNGIKGQEVKSRVNGNSIFLPYAGIRDETTLSANEWLGLYSCSALGIEDPSSTQVLILSAQVSGGNAFYGRKSGFTIRPVTE